MKYDTDKKLIGDITEKYTSSRDNTYRQYKEEVWERCYKNWRGMLETFIDRKSNLFIPITFQTVEAMVAREMSAVFNESGKLYVLEPRRKMHIDASDVLTAYMNYDFSRIPNVYRKFRQYLTQLHVYGTAIFRLFWDFKYLPEEIIDKDGNKQTVMNVQRDQFNIDVVPARNFFVDPVALNLEDARWVITRTMVDVNEFKEQMKAYEYSKLTEDELNKIAQSNVEWMDDFSELDNITSVAMDRSRKFVEVLEYWNKEEDKFIVIVGQAFVVRNEKIPFKHKKFPFLVSVDIPDPEHFWGLATTEVINDLQAEINAWRNNRMDKANMLMNPMFLVAHGELLNKNELVSRQGGIVRLRDLKNLERLDMGNMEQSDYLEEANMKTDVQATSGISDYSLGQTSGRYSETATGVSILSSNADARIVTKLQYLQEEVLKPLGMMWLSLQQQFGKSKEIFMLTGRELEFNRSMLFNAYEMKVIASTQMINKQIRQNQVMQLAQLTLNNPAVDQKEWLKTVFEVFGFQAERLLTNEAEMQGMQPPGAQGAQQGLLPGSTRPTEMGTLSGYDFVAGRPTQ